MKLFFQKIQTFLCFDPASLTRVAGYRIGLKTGLNPVKRISGDSVKSPFFSDQTNVRRNVKPSARWQDYALYFGWKKVPFSSIPDWHLNPFNGKSFRSDISWWRLQDFDSAVGDIKTIWEASRFDWVVIFAQRAACGDQKSLQRLNEWLDNWSVNNPPYCGVNWKCGQEASIRVMHLALATIILQQVKATSESVLELIRIHLQRIAPTIRYAVGQDNNHGTSEAAALFIGGSWLFSADFYSENAESRKQKLVQDRRWRDAGRKWLENRSARIIENDGSFSQYSVNYHRVMLDTLSLVEVWRRQLQLPRFSKQFYKKTGLAGKWLFAMTSNENGDAPNIGANDGARLLPLCDTDYRDYRPSVQLALALFCHECAYRGDGDYNIPLKWLGIDVPTEQAGVVKNRLFDDGGYAIIRSDYSLGVLRYPRFRFRPSHADALHFDLWHKGVNILRDGGTFSYNTEVKWLDYFPGTESHNTIEFDAQCQMPRISRFLFGAWLKADLNSQKLGDGNHFSAAYTDHRKNRHRRTVSMKESCWSISDEISGVYSSAVLRWRLVPGKWTLEGNVCFGEQASLIISGNIPQECISLRQGWESRYYMQRTSLPVLEVRIPKQVKFVSTDIELIS